MIVRACVRFYTIEYNKIPWDDRTKITGVTVKNIKVGKPTNRD
jgi:hypothetical protein